MTIHTGEARRVAVFDVAQPASVAQPTNLTGHPPIMSAVAACRIGLLRDRQYLTGIDEVRVVDTAGAGDALILVAVAVEALRDRPQGIAGHHRVSARRLGRWRWRWRRGGGGGRAPCPPRRFP